MRRRGTRSANGTPNVARGRRRQPARRVRLGALDCPGGIVTDRFGEVGLILFGRLAVDLREPVKAGLPPIVQAWPIGRDGRKLNTATALFTADGGLRAVARVVWIELPAKT